MENELQDLIEKWRDEAESYPMIDPVFAALRTKLKYCAVQVESIIQKQSDEKPRVRKVSLVGKIKRFLARL